MNKGIGERGFYLDIKKYSSYHIRMIIARDAIDKHWHPDTIVAAKKELVRRLLCIEEIS